MVRRRYQKLSWCSASIPRIVSEFDSDIEVGLDDEKVLKQRERFGSNLLETKEEIGILGKIVKQFKSPLVYILLVAGVLTLFLHEFIDALVIAIVLLINVIVGTFQEERASRAFEKLNSSQEKFASVIRGGKQHLIPAGELVPGDIVVIEGGYHVPADMRLLQAKGLSVNESTLTGEWVSVQKDIEPRKEDAPIVEQFNMAWMGTLVSSGYGKGIVVATGNDTQVGIIAENLGEVDEHPTPLQQSIRKLGRFLVYIIGFALVGIFVLGFFRGESIPDMLLISIAVAVATIPAGLPAAVSIVLALGMESILKRGGLVRNLLAAETLGATTVILTDKTGTLTEGKMALAELITLDSLSKEKEYDSEELTTSESELLKTAVLASEAFVEEENNTDTRQKLTVHGRPIEKAIIIEGLEHGLSQGGLRDEYKQLDFIRFTSSRRFGGSLNHIPKRKNNRLFLSGAPETLLEYATHTLRDGKKISLRINILEQFVKTQIARGRQGMRLIAVAYQDVDWDEIPGDENVIREKIGKNLVFVGLVAFHDPPREDVPDAIRTVKRAGARVIMLTGDNPETARKIAYDVGIAKVGDTVLQGKDIEKYDDEKLYEKIKTTKVFARVLPEQKLRIVRLLKNNNEVVAMTGDGINDAPALRSASIGVAVGSGTEVAKEAADIVLINNSFSIIVAAIEEGRKIIDNLKKIVAYLLSTSFSEIFLIGGALAFGAALPLLPVQILWANIIEEGLMSFAFAFEKPEKGIMKRDPRSARSKNILTRRLLTLIITIGLITGAFLTALYFILLQLNLSIELIRTIMFAALSLDSIFFAFSLKSLDKPIWKINFFTNWYLVASLSISVILLLAALTLKPFQILLSLEPLSTAQMFMLLGIGIFNLLTIEIVKYYIFERRR